MNKKAVDFARHCSNRVNEKAVGFARRCSNDVDKNGVVQFAEYC